MDLNPIGGPWQPLIHYTLHEWNAGQLAADLMNHYVPLPLAFFLYDVIRASLLELGDGSVAYSVLIVGVSRHLRYPDIGSLGVNEFTARIIFILRAGQILDSTSPYAIPEDHFNLVDYQLTH
ncbi:hypothetical protein AXF42_Ash021701 [Apostasia shenzhenica]|uniref:Uncharacterized protein n=1 Tax=Apostasia shenzhenica TaxID=1088818 RepID=A0A2H9ZQK8_9ASPA|nr:hypothetical protein AXF42_Ash021701 [Apostasia shenzhenica]